MENINNLFGDDELMMPTDDYKLNMIVFVNSADHYYVELPLNENMSLFGKNNNGKTASLAATKILIYPETNFKDCERKFAFVSKSGYFKAAESFQYYFPSQISYLIMEAENPQGKFTMIVYSSGNRQSYEYHRIFLPVEYSKIRHYFVDSETRKQVEDISIDTIKKVVAEFDGVNVVRQSEIRDYLFNYGSGRNSRYCLVPLTSSTTDSINVFKNIYQFAFESSSSSSKVLPNAISSIVEANLTQSSKDKESKDSNPDFYELEAQYSRLLEKNQELNLLKDFQPEYESILSNYNELKDQFVNSSVKFSVYDDKLIASKNEVSRKIEEVQQSTQVCGKEFDEAKKELEKVKNSHRDVLSDIKATKNSLSGLYERTSLVGKLEQDYGLSQEDLRAVISEKLNEKLDKKKAMMDTSNAVAQRRGVQKEYKENLDKLKQKRQVRDNKHNRLLSFLDETSANILNSINPAFAEVIKNPSEDEKQRIKLFTELFDTSGSSLRLFSTDIAIKKDFDADDVFGIEDEIDSLESSNNKLERKLNELSDIISEKQSTSATIDQVEKAIRKYSEERDALDSYNSDKRDIETKQHELKSYNQDVERYSTEISKLESEYNTKNETYKNLLEESRSLNTDLKDIEKNLEKLRSLKMRINPKPYSKDSAEYKALSEITDNVLFSDVNKLDSVVYNFAKQYTALEASINRLLERIECPDVDIHISRNDIFAYEDIITAYKDRFDSVEELQELHEIDILHHNSNLVNAMASIDRVATNLDLKIKEINKELDKRQISNLSSVQLILRLKPDFETLRDLVNKTALTGKALNKPDIYQKLIKFVNKNVETKNGERKLVLNNIIDRIDYQYTDADGGKSTAPQSGGTTTTINAAIMSLLIKETCMQGTKIALPIIVDEISQLDSDNIDTIIKQIESMNMVVFCATPAETGKICSSIANWVNITDFVSDEYRIKGCLFKIFTQDIYSIHAMNSQDSIYKLPESYKLPDNVDFGAEDNLENKEV